MIDFIIDFIRQRLCKHYYFHVRNIYGDEINHFGGKRSEWVCCKCNKIHYGSEWFIAGETTTVSDFYGHP